jgi:hypothetical protein
VRIPKILHSVSVVFVLLFVNLTWGATEQVLYSFSGGDGIPGGLIFDGAGFPSSCLIASNHAIE